MNNYETEDIKMFIDVIRRIIREEIALNRDDKHETAIIKTDNEDGTFNVALASDPDNVVSKIKNVWNLSLSINDSVQVLCKKGNLNDSWIATKNNTNTFKTT